MHTNEAKGATTGEFNSSYVLALAICIGDFIYGGEGKGRALERWEVSIMQQVWCIEAEIGRKFPKKIW